MVFAIVLLLFLSLLLFSAQSKKYKLVLQKVLKVYSFSQNLMVLGKKHQGRSREKERKRGKRREEVEGKNGGGRSPSREEEKN